MVKKLKKQKNKHMKKKLKTTRKTMKKYIAIDDKLDVEEKALMNSIARGEWRRTSHFSKQKALAKKAAENFFRKDARITLRLSIYDLKQLKKKAAYKGLPYQTFIASVLHEYAAGHFIEAA